jgi:adenylate kinase
MLRIAFLGPPGAGKGTQAAALARSLGVPHLSTGEILREAVREDSPLGREAERFMTAGQLVPDALVLDILKRRVARPDSTNGFLLDGFPRTLPQAEALTKISPLDKVVALDVPEKLLLERLTQRFSCPKCGSVYNHASRPPKTPGRCDLDGAALVQRPDDRPEAVSIRLQVYRDQTAPLLGFYEAQGLLERVDGAGSVEDVGRRVRAALHVG